VLVGKGSSVGFLAANYRSPGTGVRDWTFGIVLAGAPENGDYGNTNVDQWNGFYTGALIDKIKAKGIRFGQYFKNGSFGIWFPDSFAGTQRPAAGYYTGNTQIRFANYDGPTSNGDLWQSGGVLRSKTGNTEYDVMLNGHRALVQSQTGVGVNVPAPGFNMDVQAENAAFSAVTSYGGAANVVLRGAGGSKTTPTATLAGGSIGFIGGRGHTGGAFSSGNAVAIILGAAENWSPTANGTYIALATTPNGTAGRIDRLRIEDGGAVRPGADNAQTLGSSLFRWSTVFAGTGTINTSDARAKTDIADLDEAETRVAQRLKKLVKKYRFRDAVAQKGDGARIHVGVIAQDVKAAFEAEGLDPFAYSVLCWDKWEAQEPVTRSWSDEYDDEGKLVREAGTEVIEPAREAGDRYGIRYDELFAFILAAL